LPIADCFDVKESLKLTLSSNQKLESAIGNDIAPSPQPSIKERGNPTYNNAGGFDSGRGLDERRTAGVHNAGIRNYSG